MSVACALRAPRFLSELCCARLATTVRVSRAQVTTHKRNRRAEFLRNCREIMKAFPALQAGPTHRVYALERGEFAGMWMTLSHHIMRKRRAMEVWAEGVNCEHPLIKELGECTDPAREVAIVTEIERLQQADPCLAFKDRPDQQEYIKACSYSDLWLRQFDSCGNVIGIITSYYICLGQFGDQTDCLMLIPSKEWEREGVDPIDCNRWICTSAWHYKKYKGGWGQVVVIKRLRLGEWETYYMRAKVPEWDKEDLRAMDVEAICQGTESALEVYRKLEKIVPTKDELVVHAEHGREGSVRLRSREDLDAMPWLPWGQIYGMVDHELATPEARKAVARLH